MSSINSTYILLALNQHELHNQIIRINNYNIKIWS